MTTDPVCKMEVDEHTAAGRSEYRGKAYFFCSEQRKQAFDRNPERYAGDPTTGGGR